MRIFASTFARKVARADRDRLPSEPGSAHKIWSSTRRLALSKPNGAMLKASLGFMFSHGFRARSQPGHHIAIIDGSL